MTERIFFSSCNGEVGLTPKTRAIIEAARQKEMRLEGTENPALEYVSAEERSQAWRKNNV